jgi:uncharacterized membrane protein
MVYLWLKALHIAAVLIWIGGLLIAAITIGALSLSKGATEALGRTVVLDMMVRDIVRWDQRVTAPAMVFVWGVGLTLAMQGAWFPSLWLIIKLVLVVVLSALHGILSGTLRKVGHTYGQLAPFGLRHAPLLIIISVVAIVVLVVVKPL